MDKSSTLIINVVGLILLHVLLYNNVDGFGNAGSDPNGEAVQNVASLYNQGKLTVTDFIPTAWRGMIVAFHGAKNAVPEGWALCDGNNGTPDLRGRFIRMYNDDMSFNDDWGPHVTVNGQSASDLSFTGNARNDHSTHMVKHAIGDYSGTDHQILQIEEIPTHNHGVTYHHRRVGISDDRNGWVHGGSGSVCAKKNGPKQGNGAPNTDRGCSTPSISIQNAGNSYGHNNQPPYYVLSYIMKL